MDVYNLNALIFFIGNIILGVAIPMALLAIVYFPIKFITRHKRKTGPIS